MIRELPRKTWVVPIVVVAAAIAVSQCRRRDVGQVLENLRRYSAPSALVYDAFAARAFAGFYTRVATDLVKLRPRTRILEVGCGPGRLAARLAELAPEVRITGVDIMPEMVERASALMARSGFADRVEFRVGDVAALPFPDASFDLAVSTFSLHHWSNPSRGLAEIYRVLRPGGVARIYDIADWIRRFERRGPGSAALMRDSPFDNRGTWMQHIMTRLGPISLVYQAELWREPSSHDEYSS